jgi:ATP-binding protein involved in chromosome partitioning
MLLVTTPQVAASQVARRAARMAEKVNMEVVGIVENMSYFLPAAGAEPVYVFGRGGGAALARELEVPLLGEIPLDQSVREGGDEGRPVVISHPESAAAAAFQKAAERLRDVVPVVAVRR